MKYSVLTSFSERGYRMYGKRFLETFDKFWPEEVELYVYHEGDPGVPLKNHVKHSFNLLNIKECADFIDEFGSVDLFCGKKVDEPLRWQAKDINKRYNYKFDAVKFCRKVFAIRDAVYEIAEGKMFWVDADVLTFNHVSLELLDDVLPDNFDISYLNRPRGHSECGFVGYNLQRKRSRTVVECMYDKYVSNQVFDLSEWHDSFVFDHCVRKNVGNVRAYHIPSTQKGHVFVNSPLGEYMDHLKGDRKITGKSYACDLKVPRKNTYWENVS